MPKKTKKQKIISDYRKKISAISSSITPVAASVKSEQIYAPVRETISIHEIKSQPTTHISVTQSLVPVNEFAVIKKDLLSTLLITAIILIGEFAIAWYIRF